MTTTPIFDQLMTDRGILSPAELGLNLDTVDRAVLAAGAILEDGLRAAVDFHAGLAAVEAAAAAELEPEPDSKDGEELAGTEPLPVQVEADSPYAPPPRRRWGRR